MRARAMVGIVLAGALITSLAPAASATTPEPASKAPVRCFAGQSAAILGLFWMCQKVGQGNVMVAVATAGGAPGALGLCTVGDWVQIGKERLDCRRVGSKSVWTGATRGAIAGRADAWIQSRPARVPGACHASSWLSAVGVRIWCLKAKGKRVWTASNPVAHTSPAQSTDDVSTAPDPGKYQTITSDQVNTVFQVWPTMHPEIAQSFVVTDRAVATDVTIWPREAQFGTPEFWSQGNSPQDKTWFVKDATPISASVRVALYRSDTTSPLGTDFNLSSGFSEVGEGSSAAPLQMTQPYTVDFASPITLSPGQYVAVFSFTIPDSRLIDFRVAGRQSGNNATIGEFHDSPSDCVYTPATDGYPQGRAFKGVGTGLASLPSPMVATATVGFGTSFTQQEAKVLDCSRPGVYHDVWNQGDIQLDLSIIPAAKPIPSKTSPLPASAFAGLACNPFDPRLAGLELANGVGPEARAAAACARLDWLAGPAETSRPITVTASPGVPAGPKADIRAAIAAGDRLNGAYGSPNRTYNMLISDDLSWSCTAGAEIYDGGSVGLSQHAKKWSGQENSGCPGSSTRNGGWQAGITGPEGNGYFAWTWLQASDLTPAAVAQVNSPAWYLRFLGHEFVHTIQWQRAATHSVIPVNDFGDIESPGSWFAEGQAQYLGFTAGSLSTTTLDMRAMMLDQLRAALASHGFTSLDIGAHHQFLDMTLIYSSGYFAYEYMLAHFGSAAMWNSWNIWNSSECSVRRQNECWRDHSQQAFGVSADALEAGINAYVNAQLAG